MTLPKTIIMDDKIRYAFQKGFFPLDDKEACWPWKGKLNKDGYAKIHVYQKPATFHYIASRISYMIFHELEILHQELVLHTCHNPPCVNPHHLMLGSQLLNMQQMTEAGRAIHAKGTANGNSSVLTEELVLEIKKQFHLHGLTILALSKQFGVSTSRIGDIIHNKLWTHVKFNPFE